MSGVTSKSRGVLGLAGGCGLLIAMTLVKPAFAADSGFVNVADVNISQTGSLGVNAGTASTGYVMYYGQVSVSGCTQYNVSVDTLRAWQSQAQAALLSGKTVKITYVTANCGGTYNWITGIQFHG